MDRRKTKRVLPLYNKNSHFGLNFCYSESIINNQTVKLHWKKVSLAENSIHMERFTTRCSYWALAYLQPRSTKSNVQTQKLSMPPALPGWLRMVEHCLLDKFPSFAHIFCCPKSSGSAYSTQGRGFRSGKNRIESDLVLRMRSWPSEHMPQKF